MNTHLSLAPLCFLSRLVLECSAIWGVTCRYKKLELNLKKTAWSSCRTQNFSQISIVYNNLARAKCGFLRAYLKNSISKFFPRWLRFFVGFHLLTQNPAQKKISDAFLAQKSQFLFWIKFWAIPGYLESMRSFLVLFCIYSINLRGLWYNTGVAFLMQYIGTHTSVVVIL